MKAKPFVLSDAVAAAGNFLTACEERGTQRKHTEDFDGALFALVEQLHRARVSGGIKREKYDYNYAWSALATLGISDPYAEKYARPIAAHVRSWFEP